MKSNIEKVYSKLPQKKRNLGKHKVDLAVGDELENLSNEAFKYLDKLANEIDDAFTPIREIEKLMDRVQPEIYGLNDFTNALMKFEEQYQKDTQRINELADELGMQIPIPDAINEAINNLERLQMFEQGARDDINEYNSYLKMLFN
jgi:DNA repair exonuclease SbcCD ATPase subunit